MSRVETIGDATLYLGDCYDVIKHLHRGDTIITDPPYGMDFRSNYRQVKHDAISNDSCGEALRWACGLEMPHSKYIFCRWDNLLELPKPKSVVTWVKNNWSMGDLEHEHARQTECILFWPGLKHRFPAGRPQDVINAARTGNEHHPTEKPVSLMKAVVGWTEGVVFDPFMGSGTTGVACTKLGRKFIGIEIEPKYYEIALKRIEAAYAQPDIFIPRPAPAKQEALL